MAAQSASSVRCSVTVRTGCTTDAGEEEEEEGGGAPSATTPTTSSRKSVHPRALSDAPRSGRARELASDSLASAPPTPLDDEDDEDEEEEEDDDGTAAPVPQHVADPRP
jgi:hypothetical protein